MKTATAVLPWPKDAKGKPEKDVGWFRVGYRVESNGAESASGIISIGAIATNLMDLRLAYARVPDAENFNIEAVLAERGELPNN